MTGESIEPVKEVPLIGQGESELEITARFTERCRENREAYQCIYFVTSPTKAQNCATKQQLFLFCLSYKTMNTTQQVMLFISI